MLWEHKLLPQVDARSLDGVQSSCVLIELRSVGDSTSQAKVAALAKYYNGSIRIGMTVREHIPNFKNGEGSYKGGYYLCRETDYQSLRLWLKLYDVFGPSLKSDFPDRSSFLLVHLYCPNSA